MKCVSHYLTKQTNQLERRKNVSDKLKFKSNKQSLKERTRGLACEKLSLRNSF